MGVADRTVRTLIAVVIAVLYVTGRVSGTLGTVLLVAAAVFAVTSFVSWCAAYLPYRFLDSEGHRHLHR